MKTVNGGSMQYIRRIEECYIKEETVVTLGKFDGIHQGHQELIERLRACQTQTTKTVVFTFDISPHTLFSGVAEQILITNQERYTILEKMGIDYLIECPFTPAISGMEAEDFVKEILVKRLHMKKIIVGIDNLFGKDRRGNPELLKQMGQELGFEVVVLTKKQMDNEDISSSRIKKEMLAENIDKVNQLLGYPYTIMGEVVHGNELGRTIKVPTANIIPAKEKMLPQNGVYISKILIGDTFYKGITNIGYKPTIGEKNTRGVETHIFDYDGDLYGKEIAVQILAFERPEKKFHSIEELQQQLSLDIALGKEFFNE
jgi:riboflavin kinase/FMN adenylyltransferase